MAGLRDRGRAWVMALRNRTRRTPPGDPNQALVDGAYRLFLDRPPAPGPEQTFTNFNTLIATLFRAPEFTQSPRASKTDLGWPDAQYFIAPNAKILYCPIGKNACSFLKGVMVTISGHPQAAVIRQRVHRLTDHVRTGLQLSDYAPETVEAMLGDPELFSFVLLRDPARRLLSAYIDKFVKNRTDPVTVRHHTTKTVKAVQAARGIASPDHATGISFRDFVTHIVTQPPETLDPHWRPQALYLGTRRWSRIYRFEDLTTLVADLEKRTGIRLDDPPANQSGSGNGIPHDGADRLLPAQIEALPMIAAESFLTDDLREQITSYFSDDYALLHNIGDNRR